MHFGWLHYSSSNNHSKHCNVIIMVFCCGIFLLSVPSLPIISLPKFARIPVISLFLHIIFFRNTRKRDVLYYHCWGMLSTKYQWCMCIFLLCYHVQPWNFHTKNLNNYSKNLGRVVKHRCPENFVKNEDQMTSIVMKGMRRGKHNVPTAFWSSD